MQFASFFTTQGTPGSFNSYITAATPYLALGACVLALLALLWLFLLRRRLARLSLGKSGSIEETLAVLSRNMKEAGAFRAEMEAYLKHVETRLQSSLQGVGVVRFNPFPQSGGGNQSFAVAFLDEKLSGVVLSTLYARDRVGVYGKPIEKGVSTFELTAEEKEAIEKAKQSLKNHR